MEKKNWVVTVVDDYSIKEVEANLKKAGFEVNEVLEQIGCITGSANSSAISEVKKIAGVADVSADFSIDLGSPDAPVTW